MHKFHYYNIRRIRFFPSTILIINASGLIPKGLCFAIRNHKPSHLFLLEFRYRDSQNIISATRMVYGSNLWQFLFSSFLWFNSTNSSVPLSLWHILSTKQDEGNWICLYICSGNFRHYASPLSLSLGILLTHSP